MVIFVCLGIVSLIVPAVKNEVLLFFLNLLKAEVQAKSCTWYETIIFESPSELLMGLNDMCHLKKQLQKFLFKAFHKL